MNFDNFIKTFSPGKNCTPLNPDTIDKYRETIPETLTAFWKNYGAGKYGDGIIEVVNPGDYLPALETWLGREVPAYVPLCISAFGELFYYRKLSESDEDVCILDPHYRSINTCTWSLDEFFEEYLTDEGIIEELLRKELFHSSIAKLGEIKPGEIFLFSPALCLGGAEEIQYVSKGRADVHLDLLFQAGM